MASTPLEKSLTWTYVDGEWHAGNFGLAGPRSHGLWLGSSVFDGARWFEGIAPDLDRHCARVNVSALALGLAPQMAPEAIAALAWEGLKRFDGETAVYIRPCYWAEAGDSSWVSPDADSTRFCLSLFEAPMPPQGGFSIGVSRYRRPSLETMPVDAKAGCLYPNNARAVRDARSRGFDNALVLDSLGNVAETATSNIFMAKDGAVLTPVLNGTFLAGITRSRVISLLRADGVEVVERTLTVKDFIEADEIFSTGNYSKVTPLIRFEQRPVQPGPFGARARALYWAWAHGTARRAP